VNTVLPEKMRNKIWWSSFRMSCVRKHG